LSQEEACAVFKQQAAALEGVDLFVLETFREVAELRSAVCGVREAAGSEVVVIAHVTVDDKGNLHDGTPPERFGPAISVLPVDAIGVNCSSGPHAVAAVIDRLREVTSKPLSAIPSYEGDAAYFAELLAETGAVVVGGCCGTTPDHINALKEASLQVRTGQDVEAVDPAPQQEVPLAKRSKLGAKLAAKKFIDDSDLASLVQIRAGRRSPKQLQEELLAIHSRGDRNILCETPGLAYLASQLNRGLDMGGNAIERTSFVIGIEGAMADSADFLVTGPIFDITEIPESVIPVVATVWAIPDARTAAYAIHERHVQIPEALLTRINDGEGEAVAEEITKKLRKHVAGVRALH
jgi:homocysteine S-methyltransferase